MSSSHAQLAVAVACAIAVLAPGVAGVPTESSEPRYGPQDLFGSLARGWGFTNGGETKPGPPITVSRFESVTLVLRSSDGLPHTWALDLNMNGNNDGPPENESVPFSSPTTGLVFTFVATAPPGVYQYICGIHGTTMSGSFTILAGNAPPTASLTIPDGIVQNRWTGGSSHRLAWTMNDPDGLPSQLAVWLNFTSSASSGPISPPLFGATFFDWTLPMIDATDVTVHIDVADPPGATGTDAELVPTIDSTPPAVMSTVPQDGVRGVDPAADVVITFGEAIATLGPGTVTFNPPAGGLSPSWNPAGTVLTVGHAPLQRAMVYTVTVSDFRDASDPGNPMSPFPFSFTTANDAPTIALTQPTAASRWSGGSTHDLQWTATDTEDPAGALTVWVNYSATGGAPFSPIPGLQGVPGDTTTFPWGVPTDTTGTAVLRFTAEDTMGEAGTLLSAAFAIDSTAPTATSIPAQGAANVVLNANVVVTFSERMNAAATGVAAVVSLFDVDRGAWSPMTLSWDGAERVLTGNPLADLSPTTHYRLFVNGSALDASDPGNPMGGAYNADFNTSATADLEPPVIVHTPPNNHIPVGDPSPITITAIVTDAGSGVAFVWINYTDVDGAVHNVTMTLTTGDTYGFEIPDPERTGTITYFLYAKDGVGNGRRTANVTLTVHADEPPPSDDATVLIAAGILLIVAGIAAAAFLLWRRKKPEPPPAPPTS